MKYLVSTVALAACAVAVNTAYGAEGLRLVERPLHETTTHVHGHQDSPGDVLTFANPVFDQKNRIQVGTDHGYCIRIVAGRSWECFWTLLMKDGMVTVEGPFMDSGDSRFVITGGTDKYVGAKGQMTLHPRDATPSGYDFFYDLR